MRATAAVTFFAAAGLLGTLAAVGLSGDGNSASVDSFIDCGNARSEALLSNRIVGNRQSYAKDNPIEYLKVRAYLDGGVRPDPAGFTHMGLHLVYGEDVCRALGQPPPTSTTTAPPSGYPASFSSGPGEGGLLPSDSSEAWLGIMPGGGGGGAISDVVQYERSVEVFNGRDLHISHHFLQNRCTLDASLIDAVASEGWHPLISWSPTNANGGQTIRGDNDACIRSVGQSIAAQSHKILLRMYWEFNNPNQFAWGKDLDGSQLTPAEFVVMWRRTVEKLREGGAFPKASLVWCPGEGYYGDGSIWGAAYPGDTYTDWVCSDGYNHNSSGAYCGFHADWCSLPEIFHHGRCLGSSGQYGASCNPTRIPVGVEPDFRGRKPYMIGETGSCEAGDGGAKKGQWFRDARDYAKQFMPGLYALVYFDFDYTDSNPCDGDWRIASSQLSREGFRDLAQDPHFGG